MTNTEAEATPACDVCGIASEATTDWCGNCGNCGTHCERGNLCWYGAHIVDPDRIEPHLMHPIGLTWYGSPPANMALECLVCHEVIADLDLS